MPFGLPEAITKDADQRFQAAVTKENNLNIKARAEASVVKGANQAIDAIITGLPPPVNVAGKALSEGIYSALKIKPFPLDLERAKRLTTDTEKDIDPLKLFALMMAFAIIKAIWCFIKSILHPLPIIGWFFSLCDPEERGVVPAEPPLPWGDDSAGKIKNESGKLVDDESYIALNRSARNLLNNDQIVRGNLPNFSEALPPAPPIPQASRGRTFDEFMAENYPRVTQTNLDGGNVNLVPSAQNTQNNTANVPAPVPTDATYELGNLSSVEARRLFGL